MAQNIEEQLKDALKKLMSDRTLSEFLKKEMKATVEYMIHEKGDHGEASDSVNVKIDKGKNKMPCRHPISGQLDIDATENFYDEKIMNRSRNV